MSDSWTAEWHAILERVPPQDRVAVYTWLGRWAISALWDIDRAKAREAMVKASRAWWR